MKVGFLWFDDDKHRTLGEKIERATKRFQEKYGKQANLVYANPITIGEQTLAGNVMLKPAKSILPNHFWIDTSE